MKNDAKLGMLAGVLGVIAAAVLFAGNPPPAPERPTPTAGAKATAGPPPATTAAVQRSGSASDSAVPGPPRTQVLSSTPVGRTRKETGGQPVSRAGAYDEEP